MAFALVANQDIGYESSFFFATKRMRVRLHAQCSDWVEKPLTTGAVRVVCSFPGLWLMDERQERLWEKAGRESKRIAQLFVCGMRGSVR